MLPKKRRLNLRFEENLSILRRANRVHSEFFTLYYFYDKPGSSEFRNDLSQAAAIVSKKVEKLAVDRNKIKRQLYSILENLINEKNLWQKNAKIILVTKKSLKNNFDKMKMEVEKLFKKSKLGEK